VRLCGAYKGCFRPAPGHQNIITIETQKEKLKQQEEPRDFLCKVSNAFGFLQSVRRCYSVALGLLPALFSLSS